MTKTQNFTQNKTHQCSSQDFLEKKNVLCRLKPFGVTPAIELSCFLETCSCHHTQKTPNNKRQTLTTSSNKHNSRTSEPPEPAEDGLSRRIRAFVIVKEDNLKTMPDRSVSSRGSAGLENRKTGNWTTQQLSLEENFDFETQNFSLHWRAGCLVERTVDKQMD